MAVGIPETETTSAKIPESEIIIKARNDQREYRRIVLPNSLQVLLISDPDTDKAAASMSVGVGAFSNPDGLEGLAHFLEHMLFYASKKYPLENSYSKYITEHGGSTNAFTAHDQTNYHFDVNASTFDEALDRFAQFFINPLMSADATSREIKAVDSENKKNLLSDALRMLQLQKHLSAESHPFHGFSTGNCATLEVRPKERGVDIREELLKFYDKNYSANLMHLVVYSEKSLDELQSLVGGTFQAIRNTEKNIYLCPGQPCMHEHLQILVKTVPVSQHHKLSVVWPITPSIRHYKGAPCRYLSHLIGHEGEGSLFYIFRSLGWVTSLSAGESDWTSEFSFFNISIALTDLGHDHVEDIVGLLFKYILLLRNSGVQKWVFDELSAIAETLFHFQDKTRALNYVCNIASNMQKYPLKDWLVASSLPSEYSPELIQAILDELTQDNVRIFWASQAFKTETDQVEPWYGTEYSIRKLSTSIIQEWIQKSPDEKIHFPAPNVFIPTDLSIKDVPNKAKSPVLLRKSAYSRLWYKPDTMFSSPKAYVKIRFICPYTNHSPEAEVLTEIFTRLLMDYLNDYAYDAQVAGLYYGIVHSDTGFQVTVVGYNHKMRILVDTVLEKIADFKVKPDRFYVIKETVIKEYRNFKFQQPYLQARNYCSLILENHSWPWTEKLEILPHLEADDLMKFWPLLLSKSFLDCYLAGNIEPTEAEAMIFHVEDIFFKGPKPLCRALLPSEHLANRVVKLGRGTSHIYQSEVLNKDEQNSALLHYIQVHQDDFIMNIKLQLFALIAKQPTFHQLRSVEQLGYTAMLMQRNDMGVRGLQFIIQSSVKDPGHIETRVQAFLREFESKLYKLSNDEFKSNVDALIDMKLEKFKNLIEESAFYWKEISDGTLKFDRKEAEVAALKTLTKTDLTNFFDEYVKVGAPNKRTLSVQVYGNLHSNEYIGAQNEPLNGESTRIEDIFSFRRSQSLYGSFIGGLAQMKL